MFIIAVTSCATGIAHSYMSAEAIKKYARKMDILAKSKYKEHLESKISYRNQILPVQICWYTQTTLG